MSTTGGSHGPGLPRSSCPCRRPFPRLRVSWLIDSTSGLRWTGGLPLRSQGSEAGSDGQGQWCASMVLLGARWVVGLLAANVASLSHSLLNFSGPHTYIHTHADSRARRLTHTAKSTGRFEASSQLTRLSDAIPRNSDSGGRRLWARRLAISSTRQSQRSRRLPPTFARRSSRGLGPSNPNQRRMDIVHAHTASRLEIGGRRVRFGGGH